MKVENPLFFIKLLKNQQFLTKIHKVGLVWSATLKPTDRISKNAKFQYLIVTTLLQRLVSLGAVCFCAGLTSSMEL